MSYKDLLKGKRKFATIPVLAIFAAYFWPFLIGAALAYLAFTYIPYSKVKFVAIGLIVLFTLPAGTGWVLGMTGQVDPVEEEVAGAATAESTATPVPHTPTPEPTVTPQQASPTPEPTATRAPLPTSTPIPTKKPVVVYPTATKAQVQQTPFTPVPVQQQPAQQTAPPQQATGGCNCSLTCTQITSCAEAQYQLNTCGCKVRDGDNDGIACDGAPLRCQQ